MLSGFLLTDFYIELTTSLASLICCNLVELLLKTLHCYYYNPLLSHRSTNILCACCYRSKSLAQVLASLVDLELDGASSRVEIWIDRDHNNMLDNQTFKVGHTKQVSFSLVSLMVTKSHVCYRLGDAGSNPDEG